MGSPFGAGNSESKTDVRTLSGNVGASEGGSAAAIIGKNNQTGGVQARDGGQVVTGGYVLGKGATLSIYNEAPQSAGGLLEAYVRSQTDSGLSSASPAAAGGYATAPNPFDSKMLGVIAAVVVALAFVFFKRH